MKSWKLMGTLVFLPHLCKCSCEAHESLKDSREE
jgi:hypothetical protein